MPDAERPPIVWLHGLTASFRFWEAAMYEEIKQKHGWYSVSMPLHHPSTFDGADPELTEDIFAELLAVAINELIPDGPFHLVGYSLGGFAALNYVAKYPERVLSVVSVGGFMTGRARGLEGALQFFSKGKLFRKALFHASWWVLQRHVFFLKVATFLYARRWRQLSNYPELDATLANIFPDVRRHRVEHQRLLFRYLLDMNVMDELEKIQLPVLVIAGDKDPVIPFAHQRAYAAALPQADLLVLPGVGHVSFAEAAEAFREATLRWFAGAYRTTSISESPLPR